MTLRDKYHMQVITLKPFDAQDGHMRRAVLAWNVRRADGYRLTKAQSLWGLGLVT